MGNRFVITNLDYEPRELSVQLPIKGTLERKIRGSDRPDYWIASLDSPIVWPRTERDITLVNFLVMASHLQNLNISFDMEQVPVGIAYITDESLLNDSNLDFKKCEYVAIGIVSTEYEK